MSAPLTPQEIERLASFDVLFGTPKEKETGMPFYVTYRESLDLDETTLDSVAELNDAEDASDLEAIRANCKRLSVDADLYDAAGFRKGWVKADGNYRLA